MNNKNITAFSKTLQCTIQNLYEYRKQVRGHGRIYYTYCTVSFTVITRTLKTVWSIVNISVDRLNHILGHFEQPCVFLDFDA
jgi:hypothetical protein